VINDKKQREKKTLGRMDCIVLHSVPVSVLEEENWKN